MTQPAARPGSGAAAEPDPDIPRPLAALRASAAVAGMAAAGLVLLGLAAVVLLLWVASPFPDSGLGGALHIAADLWLLAHGAALVRDTTLSGVPAPVGVTPLLLSVLPAWLLYRGTASAVANGTRACAGWVLGGYLAVAVPVTAYAAAGSLHADVLSALLHVPLLAAAATAAGAWAGRGRPPLSAYRAWGGDVALALRAGGIGAGVLVGGGAVVGAVALGWHAGAAGRTFGQLSAPFAGQVAVFLLCVLLVPNLAVWSAAYALGPGFSVGAGSTVAPTGASGYPLLPRFPLLAALPGQGGPHPAGWATLAVPVLAAGALGWVCVRARLRTGRTALVVAGAAGTCGLALGVLAAASGGPLGVGSLARVGPAWWLTAAAAAAWPLALVLPPAVAVAWFRTRTPRTPRTPAVPNPPTHPPQPPARPQPLQAPRGFRPPVSAEPSRPSVPPVSAEPFEPSVPPVSAEPFEPSVPPVSAERSQPFRPSVPPVSAEPFEPPVPPVSAEWSQPFKPPVSAEPSRPFRPSAPPVSPQPPQPPRPPQAPAPAGPQQPPQPSAPSEPSAPPVAAKPSAPPEPQQPQQPPQAPAPDFPPRPAGPPAGP
ncbi:DUF6350 family protein [Streptomyces sp. NRRL F-5123]|uniref:cell division protein PerM n=1 Tax=Streptomyces sp. NRRL F-5123 TaxID=1463856 RepID=UPI000693B8CB|nr:DUF6350 family protein [Streptomyces sp. NRRL F-5123]